MGRAGARAAFPAIAPRRTRVPAPGARGRARDAAATLYTPGAGRL